MMGLGEFMAFTVLVGGIVVVVRTLAQTYQRKLAVREREIELALQHRASPVAASDNPAVAKLEERVRVLERIATDADARHGAAVSREIEALRHNQASELQTGSGVPLNIEQKERA
ncbi:MAG: hypothetical protein ACO25F_07830 [Erythrobacter sp.]